MGRQKTKISDRFGSGGNKDGSEEEKFFTDTDIQIDPEWKVMDLLRSQIDDITDTVNANDAASGSYADLKNEFLTTSGSLSTRVTLNDAKTGVSTGQTTLLTNLNKGVTNSTGYPITFALNEEGALVITVNRSTYTIAADR